MCLQCGLSGFLSLLTAETCTKKVVADNGALEGVVSVWDIITGLRVAIETAPVHDFGHVAPAYLQQTVESIVRPTITLPHSVTLTKLIEFFASGTQHVFLVDDEDKVRGFFFCFFLI